MSKPEWIWDAESKSAILLGEDELPVGQVMMCDDETGLWMVGVNDAVNWRKTGDGKWTTSVQLAGDPVESVKVGMTQIEDQVGIRAPRDAVIRALSCKPCNDRWAPDPRYADLPDHDLRQVPMVVLDAARSITRDAARWKDVDPEQADPIAEAVIADAFPVILEWLRTKVRRATPEEAQAEHERRQEVDPEHDRYGSCACCCEELCGTLSIIDLES